MIFVIEVNFLQLPPNYPDPKNVVSIEQGGRFAKVRYQPYYCLKYLQLVFLSLYLSYYF